MHANWAAFETVLATCRPEEYDQVLVLGDLVGYGARPNEIVQAVQGLAGAAVIRGNHDKVASGIESDEGFNPAARLAALWTSQNLTPENLAYVRNLPQGPVEPNGEITICHGTPHDEDAYVLSMEEALDCFRSSDSRIILFGHTHVTCSFVLDEEQIEMRWGMKDGDKVQLDPDKRYLINPGSVGQPRDGDPLASCLTLDTELNEATWHRIDYPIDVAQKRILDADLPYFLAERLESGV
jgi:diadenosine tetraphosphatase ApaH/serine/threonine PP2A family protein phosphatase